MKRLIPLAFLLASCASVPRDAGVADVRRVVSERLQQDVTIHATPQDLDDARVSALLGDGVTPDEAVAIAMMNSPRLQVTLADLGIARAELMDASTIANPIFEFEIRFPGEPYRPYELRLAQSLIELIQLPRRRALGRAAFDAAQMRVSSEVLAFAGEVRSAYYDVVAATQHAELSRVNHLSAQAGADLALRQHAAGNITDLDLENEQALYEQAKLDLARAGQRLVLARETLVRVMGLREGAPDWRVPADFPELPDRELDQAELERLAAAQRLDLAIARRELEIAQRTLPVSRLAALGEVEVDFHYEREPGGERTKGPGIELPIPIFNSGRAAKSRAEAEYLRARHALNAMTVESSSQLRAVRSTVGEARARVEYYRDVILPRRRRIVELTKLEHNAMLVGAYQLLQARQDEARAQREFVDAQRDYWDARTDLDRVLQGVAGDDSADASSSHDRENQSGLTRGGH